MLCLQLLETNYRRPGKRLLQIILGLKLICTNYRRPDKRLLQIILYLKLICTNYRGPGKRLLQIILGKQVTPVESHSLQISEEFIRRYNTRKCTITLLHFKPKLCIVQVHK